MEINYNINPKVSFSIKNTNITGIFTDDHQEVITNLTLNNSETEISVNNEKLQSEEKEKLKQKIVVITEMTIIPFLKTVEDYMDYAIKVDLLSMKNPSKKKEDSLKILGLDQTYLNKDIITLSSSEKFQVQLAIALLSNPEILIFDNPFTYLDLVNEKKLINLLQRLKEQFHKIIVIIEDDSNKLYKYTDKMLFIKNNQLILDGQTTETYTRVDFLKRHRLAIPSIVELTYKAKKEKGVKIIYHKDIRDLIKDIYKHV